MAFNQIPVEVYLNYILPYVVRKPMKLLYWIDINKLNWSQLSGNPNAIELLITYGINPDKIDWFELSGNENPEAIELLKQNPDKIDRYYSWYNLSKNPYAMRQQRIFNVYQDQYIN